MEQTAHAVLVRPDRDEMARQAYARALSRYLILSVYPGNEEVFESRAKPTFVAAHGREPRTLEEVGEVMTADPYYQAWSSLRRAKQEYLWETVEVSVERQIDQVNADARAITAEPKYGTLQLDPELSVPGYVSAVDIHVMPGGYHTERHPDSDVFQGALYDRGVFIYAMGQYGPENNAMGRSVINNFLVPRYPNLKPRRILDLGCTVGHATLPYVDQYPDAEVWAIDVAAPCLRYAHARAESLGKRVHFVQANAEQTNFPEDFFDLIVSHIFIHETSTPAVRRILRECHRILAPGGLMAHVDAQQQYKDMQPFKRFITDWDTENNNEPYFRAVHQLDFRHLVTEAGFPESDFLEELVETPRIREGSTKKGGMFVVAARKSPAIDGSQAAVAGAGSASGVA